MKAAAAGSPGQIEWIEMDEPSVEPGGVLLRSLACGVCSTDVKLVRAGYSGGPRYALGHELVGEVVAAIATTADTASRRCVRTCLRTVSIRAAWPSG